MTHERIKQIIADLQEYAGQLEAEEQPKEQPEPPLWTLPLKRVDECDWQVQDSTGSIVASAYGPKLISIRRAAAIVHMVNVHDDLVRIAKMMRDCFSTSMLAAEVMREHGIAIDGDSELEAARAIAAHITRVLERAGETDLKEMQ